MFFNVFQQFQGSKCSSMQNLSGKQNKGSPAERYLSRIELSDHIRNFSLEMKFRTKHRNQQNLKKMRGNQQTQNKEQIQQMNKRQNQTDTSEMRIRETYVRNLNLIPPQHFSESWSVNMNGNSIGKRKDDTPTKNLRTASPSAPLIFLNLIRETFYKSSEMQNKPQHIILFLG
ncbi:unnamed protein product [Paramecium primaurelia]|uniref:Uncharacterized protein n=1 Tax=Paramecium primaurelia TaxID=5886 RepID=A0A8S1JQH0_PARPR|nr:unnamed protein product [Paramecium primaurelia]